MLYIWWCKIKEERFFSNVFLWWSLKSHTEQVEKEKLHKEKNKSEEEFYEKVNFDDLCIFLHWDILKWWKIKKAKLMK